MCQIRAGNKNCRRCPARFYCVERKTKLRKSLEPKQTVRKKKKEGEHT